MKCVLAVDLREEENLVLKAAIAWCKRMGATLDLVFVDETPLYQPVMLEPSAAPSAIWDKTRELHQGNLAALVEELPEVVRGKARFLEGRAFDEIARISGDYDAMFIGTHSRKGVAHLLMGSVAERVVRTAACPVVVLPISTLEA